MARGFVQAFACGFEFVDGVELTAALDPSESTALDMARVLRLRGRSASRTAVRSG